MVFIFIPKAISQLGLVQGHHVSVVAAAALEVAPRPLMSFDLLQRPPDNKQ
jgi:hypothetical protein